MLYIKIFIGFSSVLLLISCSSESPSDLIAVTPTDEIIKYTNIVKPTIDNNCLFCHGVFLANGSPMSLITYEEVKEAMLNRGLVDRLLLENGDGLLMPQGGPKLPQNKIDEIIKWQADGLLE